jgi:hypothetical protein
MGESWGSAATRSLVDTPSPRTLPSLTKLSAGGTSQNMSWTCPAAMSVSAGTEPR